MYKHFFNNNMSGDGMIALDKSRRSKKYKYIKLSVTSLLILALFTIGLMAQFSAGSWRYALSHAIKWMIAFTASTLISRHSLKTILRYSYLIYAFLLILLCYVSLMGWVSKGAQRWIDLGFIHIEPSEFFKIALPLLLTKMISNQTSWQASTFLKCIACILPVFILILKQPDLGTGLLVLFLSTATLIAGDLPWLWILTPICGALVSAPYLWSILHVYQKNRILNLFQPEADPLGSGYHILQSMIAVGSGGWHGKGFLQNTQSQLEYLPEHATDFVFALWAEEWGFFGSLFLIILFASLSLWLLHQAMLCKNRAAGIILQVISVQLALSSIINIAMVLGMLPVVGVPLPFISLGGSNALLNGICIGIALSCLKRIKVERSFS